MSQVSPPFATVSSAAGISIVYKSASSNRLMIATSFDGTSWPNPLLLPANLTTNRPPAAALWQDQICVLYCSSANDGTMWSVAGPDWNAPAPLPGSLTTNASPALAVCAGQLCAVYLSSANDRTMWLARSSNRTTWVAESLPLTYTTPFVPAVASDGTSLYVLFRSTTDERLWLATYEGLSVWKIQVLPEDVTTSGTPALTYKLGELGAAFRSARNDSVSVARSFNRELWQLDETPATTTRAPTITSIDRQFFVLYQSTTDPTVWLTRRLDDRWDVPEHLPASITVGS